MIKRIIVILAIIPLFIVGCSGASGSHTTIIKTFNSSSDAYVVMTGNTDWSSSRNSVMCNHIESPGTQVETSFYNDAYDIYRTFLYFDTSSIPSGSKINNVKLDIFISGVIYDQDSVSLDILSGNNYISIPAVCSDFNFSKYNNEVIGSVKFSDMSTWKNLHIDLDSNCIGENGYTKLILLTNIDKNDIAPDGWDWITFDGTNSVYCPKLEVSYTR